MLWRKRERERGGEWETFAKRVRKREKEEEIAFANGVLRYTKADLLVVFTSKRTVSSLPRLAGLPSIQLYQHVNAVRQQYLSPVNCPLHDDENGSVLWPTDQQMIGLCIPHRVIPLQSMDECHTMRSVLSHHPASLYYPTVT